MLNTNGKPRAVLKNQFWDFEAGECIGDLFHQSSPYLYRENEGGFDFYCPGSLKHLQTVPKLPQPHDFSGTWSHLLLATDPIVENCTFAMSIFTPSSNPEFPMFSCFLSRWTKHDGWKSLIYGEKQKYGFTIPGISGKRIWTTSKSLLVWDVKTAQFKTEAYWISKDGRLIVKFDEKRSVLHHEEAISKPITIKNTREIQTLGLYQ